MKKQKKQSLLNAIIVILVLALIMMIGSIIYEEKINMNKQQIQNTSSPSIENDYKDEDDNETIVDEEELPNEENENEIPEEEPTQVPTQEPTKVEEQYVGEEENNAQKEDTRSNDEKAIDLVKKQWGNDDSVTFSIEKKNGTKYYVAVKSSSSTETVWYVVNIETWEVSEY